MNPSINSQAPLDVRILVLALGLSMATVSALHVHHWEQAGGAGKPVRYNYLLSAAAKGPNAEAEPAADKVPPALNETEEGASGRHPHDVFIDNLFEHARLLPNEFERAGEQLRQAWHRFKDLFPTRAPPLSTTSGQHEPLECADRQQTSDS